MKFKNDPKILLIVAIENHFLTLITKQVKDMLDDHLDIIGLTVDRLDEYTISQADAILLSSNFIHQFVKHFFKSSLPVLFADRAVNLVNLKKLMMLPKGQTLLVVNDNKRNTDETVESLREVLLEHQIIPYYPDFPIEKTIDYIVTPGERQLVPHSIGHIIDIGPRVLALRTFSQLIETLRIEINEETLVNRYIKSLVMLSDGVQKPFSQPVIHRFETRNHVTFDDVLKANPSLSQIINNAMEMAEKKAPLHIKGEVGTGKKMLAEAIHSYSPFHNDPFFCVNCAMTSSDDLEKELFGTNNGTDVKAGLIEAINKGSLLLKNIEKSDLSLQEKLADLIVNKKFVRSDGMVSDVKIRIITSSSMDLSGLVEVGRFHTQLFLIMEANTIEIPPLRARREDFDSLLLYFKQRFNYSHFIFSKETLHLLKNYSWPGNVSELFNILSYCACLKESPVTISLLPYYLQELLEKEDTLRDGQKIIKAIEQHGFLDESIAMLDLLLKGKQSRTSYGRKTLEILLKNKHGILLSEQQLRKRLEVLHELDLIHIRQGRSGTTISSTGEWFLNLQSQFQKNG